MPCNCRCAQLPNKDTAARFPPLDNAIATGCQQQLPSSLISTCNASLKCISVSISTGIRFYIVEFCRNGSHSEIFQPELVWFSSFLACCCCCCCCCCWGRKRRRFRRNCRGLPLKYQAQIIDLPPPPFNYGPYIGSMALSSDQQMPAAAIVPFSLQYRENLEFGSKIFQGTHSPLNTTVITFNSWHCLHRIMSEILTSFVFSNRPRKIYRWLHNAATSWRSHKFKAQLCSVWKTSCNNLVAGTTTQPMSGGSGWRSGCNS